MRIFFFEKIKINYCIERASGLSRKETQAIKYIDKAPTHTHTHTHTQAMKYIDQAPDYDKKMELIHVSVLVISIYHFINAFDNGFELALAQRVQDLASHRVGKGWAYYVLQYMK